MPLMRWFTLPLYSISLQPPSLLSLSVLAITYHKKLKP